MNGERPHRRGRQHHTDEQLLAYMATTAEQKLRWLYAMWRFMADFMPAEARRRREVARPPARRGRRRVH